MNKLVDFKNFLNKEYNINAKIYKRKYKYIHTNIKNILYDIVLLFCILLFFIFFTIKFFKNIFDSILFIVIMIIINK
jgi:hypothetical protein